MKIFMLTRNILPIGVKVKSAKKLDPDVTCSAQLRLKFIVLIYNEHDKLQALVTDA